MKTAKCIFCNSYLLPHPTLNPYPIYNPFTHFKIKRCINHFPIEEVVFDTSAMNGDLKINYKYVRNGKIFDVYDVRLFKSKVFRWDLYDVASNKCLFHCDYTPNITPDNIAKKLPMLIVFA